ncbi:MAG: ABC transporter ATP-binding protein [Acidimicrobiales bacterium]
MSVTISVSQLGKAYRSRIVLEDVSFEAGGGSVVAVVGPNGAGKTTLFRILAGLAKASSGSFSITPVSAQAAPGAKLAALIDGPGLYGQLSGPDNLRVLAWTAGLAVGLAEAKRAMARVGLHAGSTRLSAYSTGMRQRLAVASVLLGEANLLILDEPTSGMDTVGIRDMRELIASLSDEGRTILWSSHDLREVEDLAGTLVLLDRGRPQYCGPPADLPARGEVIELVVERPGEAVQLLAAAGLGAEASPTGGTVRCEGVPLQRLLEVLTGGGIVPSDVRVKRSNLEELFFRLADSGACQGEEAV